MQKIKIWYYSDWVEPHAAFVNATENVIYQIGTIMIIMIIINSGNSNDKKIVDVFKAYLKGDLVVSGN